MNQKSNFHSEECSQTGSLLLLLSFSHISTMHLQFGGVQLWWTLCFLPVSQLLFPLVQSRGAGRNIQNSLLNVQPHLCAFFLGILAFDIAADLQGFWMVPCLSAGYSWAGRWLFIVRDNLDTLPSIFFFLTSCLMFSQSAKSSTCRHSFLWGFLWTLELLGIFPMEKRHGSCRISSMPRHTRFCSPAKSVNCWV